ncbi:hypothetical protein OEG84_17750 [Hoeflea sp. G2-23]|uniref:Uncharacterized protein n=1 Tax=Hoeflea algicola TaxID=2983763 RepID=A0ABT3ZCJ5_9HYPH|nr:hypothetical protein [Hoeflea algicola]MCY0149500.1 hypothetical protein [Hoeflea algicola]
MGAIIPLRIPDIEHQNSNWDRAVGKYGEAATAAAILLSQNQAMPPRLAWESAVRDIFPNSKSSRMKGCPRDAFLALCGNGDIRNVASGSYTRSIKNKGYVERALAAIRSDPNLALNQKALWLVVMNGTKKMENSQMDVLSALYLNGHIK